MPKTMTALAAAAVCWAFNAAAAEPDFNAERLKAHAGFLSDSLLEGREAGARGHSLAALYIETEFKLMGLSPAGEGGGYALTVPLSEARPQGPGVLTITTPKGTVSLTSGDQALVAGPIGGGAAAVTGPLVFAGYGLSDAVAGVDDYKGLDAAGKIVVVLQGAPKGLNSDVAAHLYHEQARVAAAHGALAVIGVPDLASLRVAPWAVRARAGGASRTTWVGRDGRPFDPHDAMKVNASINPAAASALFDGASLSLEAVLKTADEGKTRPTGFALSATAAMSASTAVRRYSSPDVIGLIEGADPELKHQYVVVMAHADHLGVRPDRLGDPVFHGAIDNAAGVSVLLEIARALKSGPAPRRSVLILATTAEEEGLLGADYFAQSPTVPAAAIVAAVNLDNPILFYDFKDVIAFGANHSTIQTVAAEASAKMNLTLSPDVMREQTIFLRSDHYALARVGVPIVHIGTGMQNGGAMAWARYFAKAYHQPSDDMSQPINWDAGAKLAKLNYLIKLDLADRDQPPLWFKGDYFGEVFAPNALKAARP